MKRQLYYRKCPAPGPDKFATPEGLDLAINAGGAAQDDQFSIVFYAPLPISIETALAFCNELVKPPLRQMRIREIGTDAVLDEAVNDKFRELLASGLHTLQAVRNSQIPETFRDLAKFAAVGVLKMMEQIEDGKKGLAFGFSPIIELAAEALSIIEYDYSELAELEGLVFESESGQTYASDLISMSELVQAAVAPEK